MSKSCHLHRKSQFCTQDTQWRKPAAGEKDLCSEQSEQPYYNLAVTFLQFLYLKMTQHGSLEFFLFAALPASTWPDAPLATTALIWMQLLNVSDCLSSSKEQKNLADGTQKDNRSSLILLRLVTEVHLVSSHSSPSVCQPEHNCSTLTIADRHSGMTSIHLNVPWVQCSWEALSAGNPSIPTLYSNTHP